MIIPYYTDGSLSASATYVSANVEDSDTVAVQVTGTWSGTLAFECSLDDDTWADLAMKDSSGTTATTLAKTATANGLFLVETNAMSYVRVYADAIASGTADVRIRASRSSK